MAAVAFDHRPRTRIVYGAGAVDRLGELVRPFGAAALLVTDFGLVAAGHTERAEASLHAAGVAFRRYDRSHENPTSSDVADCLAFAREGAVDVIIGFGGGSSIDTAKGCGFLLSNGGTMEDYWGHGKATQALPPLIAVPTTAGTGTEVQSFTLIERDGDHQKMACGHDSAAPRVALLDPTLTLSLPASITAVTGLDTVGHAVEAFVTRKGNAVSSLYAAESLRLANGALPRVLAAPNDLDARADMLLAATWAGLAIENSMLGAAHSLANPLTAHSPISHGEAVGRMLPHVVRYNAGEPTVAARYAELAARAGLGSASAAALIDRLVELLGLAGVEAGLAAAFGLKADDLDRLAAEASRQWTAQFNPRAVGEPELRELYAHAL